MAEFRAGDRVMARQEAFKKKWGVGTIRAVIDIDGMPQHAACAVEFDGLLGGHDCRVEGIPVCKSGHGRWFMASCLEPAEILPEEIKLSFEEIFNNE